MKRLVQILATTVLGLGLSAGIASADGCSIVDTGPNSDNVCSTTDTNDLTITCNNNVDVVSVNGQSAKSGNVTLTGNTSGGYSYSGNAVNTSSTNNKLDVGCGPAVATSVTPSAPAGGKGAGTTPAATPVATAKTAAPAVAALPETGSNTALAVATGGVAVLGGSLIVSRLGVLAFRRHSLK